LVSLWLRAVAQEGTFTASISKPQFSTETESAADFEKVKKKGFKITDLPQDAAEIMEGIVETFLQREHLPKEEVDCLQEGTRHMTDDVLLVGTHVVMFTQELIGARDAMPELGNFGTTTTPDQEWLKDQGLMAERRLEAEQDSPDFLMDASAVVMELGLSMQKVAALSHQILHTCLQNDGLEALKHAAEHAMNVTYLTQRVFINGADVATELADSVEKWHSDDRRGFGRDMGTALRKLVLSPVHRMEVQALPSTRVLVNITDAFLASFFGPHVDLHVRIISGDHTTDDFRVNLHECFGQNADMVKKMWASTMEVFRATAEKRLHKAEGVSEEKEDDDLRKTLAYDMMQIPIALSKCNLDDERQQMMKDAFTGLSGDTMSLEMETPGKVSSYSVENQLARAVESWRDLSKDGGISFGHALGKLFQDLASVSFPQKYLVDDLGRLQRKGPVTSPRLRAIACLGLLGFPGFGVLLARRRRRNMEADLAERVPLSSDLA